ncbi:MAG: hypothetical protein Q7R71_00790 [bacterium]|nr:hypothetical protein [bacterium]
MEGFGSFHEKARDEEKAGKRLEDHNTNLFDEGGDIDEATGKKRNNSPVVSGADEKLSKKSSELRLPKLPDKPEELEQWIKKETERLENKKGLKKAA